MGNIIGRINAAPNPTPANDALILMNSNSRDSAPFERPAVAVWLRFENELPDRSVFPPSLIRDNAATREGVNEKKRK